MADTPESFKWAGTNQYFAAIIVNLISFTQGSAYGWASPAIPQLMSNDTPLRSGALSTDQISWIGSINSIGATISSLVFCYFISLLGAKRASICIAIPYAIAYLLIYFGETFVHILVARFLSGFAGGGTDCTITIFISEISNDNIRGRLASMTPLYRNFGILFAFIIGARVDYQYVPCINIVVPILFFIAFILFPNSPQYHLQRSQVHNAEKSLKFYKGYKGDANDHQADIAFHKEFERLKAIANEPKSKEKTTISDFYNRNALKGLGIGMALFTFYPLTAVSIITSYSVTTLEKVGTSIDPYTASILLAVALIFGSLTSTYLADIMGRRILNLISFVGATAGFAGTASYHYLNQNGLDLSSVAWIPVVCLFFVVFICAAGFTSLVSVCCIEHLPPNVRTAAMAIIYCWANICQFVSLKTYPKLLEFAGLLGFLMIYGIGCIVAAIFILFVLKETAGKSIDDVGVDAKAKDTANADDTSTRV